VNDLLFVYGTLMRGGRNELTKVVRAKFVGCGTIRGRLYELGSFPGARPGRAGVDDLVRGELYRLLDPDAAIRELDRYEGFDEGAPGRSEFVREMVTVALDDGGENQAWAYWYNRPVDESRVIAGGDRREVPARGCSSASLSASQVVRA
jgi:gamma-glutamylcyclotransferase (GGCT)/AIG2-like uncharacterized protein YtfP